MRTLTKRAANSRFEPEADDRGAEEFLHSCSGLDAAAMSLSQRVFAYEAANLKIKLERIGFYSQLQLVSTQANSRENTVADPKRSAVILVDMAHEFIEPGYFIADAGGPDYQARAKAIIAPMQRLLEGARKAGALVVYSTDEHTPDDLEMRKWPPHSMKGTKSSEIVPELAMQPGDLSVPKTTYSGFQCSDMESLLRSKGIDTLYITGLHTDCCCRHTSGDAFQKGFNLVWVTDCLQAFTQEGHESGLEYFKTWYATDPENQFLTADEVVS